MICRDCGESNPEDLVECRSCGSLLVDVFAGAEDRPREPLPAERSAGSARLFGNRYEILELLGEGGMGRVYKARDRELDKIIALKAVRSERVDDPEAIQ